jgi:hypothetical protein
MLYQSASAGNLVAGVWDSSDNYAVLQYTIEANQIYIVVVTFKSNAESDNELRLYVNGTEVDSDTAVTIDINTTSNQEAEIGATNDGANGYGFQGDIHCVYTFDKCLTSTQVEQLSEELAAVGNSSLFDSDANMVVHFGQSVGNITSDIGSVSWSASNSSKLVAREHAGFPAGPNDAQGHSFFVDPGPVGVVSLEDPQWMGEAPSTGVDDDSVFGHEFAVGLDVAAPLAHEFDVIIPVDTSAVLAHDFAVELDTSVALAHQFTMELDVSSALAHRFRVEGAHSAVLTHDFAVALDTVSVRGHEFRVSRDSQITIAHDFAVGLTLADELGHEFTVKLDNVAVLVHDFAVALDTGSILAHDFAVQLNTQIVLTHDFAVALTIPVTQTHRVTIELDKVARVTHDFAVALDAVSIWTHDFAVRLDNISMLQHIFTSAIPAMVRVGHSFRVAIPLPPITPVTDADADKLAESLEVTRKEPDQLDVPVVIEPEEEEEVAPEDRLRETKEKFEKWIKAAEQMQTVLGEKLKNRKVKVPVSKDLSVRDAIARLFGVDSDTVTYDMFKYCLELRSKILEEQRRKNYGTSKSLPGNTDGSSTEE